MDTGRLPIAAILLASALAAGCLGGAPSRSPEATVDPTYQVEWQLSNLGEGWAAVELVPLATGTAEISGTFEVLVDGGLVERGALTYEAPPFCATFWARGGGGELYMPIEGEPVVHDRGAGIDVRMSSPFGRSQAWSFLPSEVEINETHVGQPFFVLVGIGNVGDWVQRGATGKFIVDSTAPLEVRGSFSGPLVCTDSFDDFEGELRTSPAGTQATDLRRDVTLAGTGHIWFFASADTALEMRIEKDGGQVWSGGLPAHDEQIHYSEQGLAAGTYALMVPTLEDSAADERSPWVRSLVLSGMDLELGRAIKRGVDALEERAV